MRFLKINTLLELAFLCIFFFFQVKTGDSQTMGRVTLLVLGALTRLIPLKSHLSSSFYRPPSDFPPQKRKHQ